MLRALILYYLKYPNTEKTGEMLDLAKAAGYTIVGEYKFNKLHKDNYLSDLKMSELQALIGELSVETILINEAVSIRYMKALNDALDPVVILDKPMLILEIFEKKSNTIDIRLQTQLAQLKYTAPRMRSEVGAGVQSEKQGFMGTGEKITDVVKSDMRKRIAKIERKLNDIQIKITPDETVPKLPIMGFYSAGKTTLFNLLSDSNRDTGDEAFTTMLLKSTWIKITGFPVQLVDTIGLVDLPPAVLRAFDPMLKTIFSLHGLILCIDASTNDNQFNLQLDNLIKYHNKFAVDGLQYNILFVLTKCDLIGKERYDDLIKLIEKRIETEEKINNYEIMGSRMDKPEYVRNEFVRLFDLLFMEKIVEFNAFELEPKEISTIHNHARVLSETWENGKCNIHGITIKSSLKNNLGFLKNKIKIIHH